MSGKNLRIVYMGTPDFAVAPLRALVEGGYNIVGVVTMPDKPAGRGLKLHESPVKQYAAGAGLRIMQPERLKDPAFVEELRNLNADLCIVVAFRMLPEVVWSMPRLGTFNLHASLLPQYRGAAPINWAIINGETKTGVTTFFLNNRIDEGEIIDRREALITPEDNAGTLHDKLMEAGTGLVLDTVDRIGGGNVQTIRQDNIPADELKPAPKIFRETCRIDFSKPGAEIVNLVRGLSPYPAAWAEMIYSPAIGAEESESITVKIYKASFQPLDAGSVPETVGAGRILSDGKNFLRVACSDGLVDIEELQAAGKRRMSIREYLRGVRSIEDFRML